MKGAALNSAGNFSQGRTAMEAPTLWWILAGLLVAAELTTGSFYLLMLALGAAVGAIAAHLGLGTTAQVAAAGLSGGLSTLGWYLYRRRHVADAPDTLGNRNVNLDVGETVQVLQWDEQGLTQVKYRGANWAAHYVGTGTPAPGPHRIKTLRGNQLEIEPV
jgi:membrane protein implicated in regulation of membrane protease activity